VLQIRFPPNKLLIQPDPKTVGAEEDRRHRSALAHAITKRFQSSPAMRSRSASDFAQIREDCRLLFNFGFRTDASPQIPIYLRSRSPTVRDQCSAIQAE
jgi:hypothetical protein